jgi:hypothetical protein
MGTAYERLFKSTVQDPLERVIGRSLTSVAYFVLACDVPGYDLSAPNESGGCQGVWLGFADGEMELDWDFREAAFRDDSTHFYLVARSASERSAAVREAGDTDEGGLVRADVPQVGPWSRMIGETLETVAVWGWKLADGEATPQAVSLTFASEEITVAIGYSERTATGWGIGDGDEVLVFDEAEWSQRLQRLDPNTSLDLIWRTSSEASP